ncbi:FKBP-type peptidyl-prolyl cis-trans isomerase [Candidatus Parcubacteria bacterium]|nr:FKBP-type peptidyl-prolyl cis-trans isomerase [Candidatus Parcubacteria bacterium]
MYALVIIVVLVGIWLFKGKVNKSSLGLNSNPSNSPEASPTASVSPSAPPQGKVVTLKDGLQMQDLVVGTGAQAIVGKLVSVQYTGWLTNGTKFDSSYDHGQPFQFQLGAGQVIKGWDEGVQDMKVGGKRRLVIPASLGYGSQAMGNVIPANSTLVFDVELLAVSQ